MFISIGQGFVQHYQEITIQILVKDLFIFYHNQ